MVNFNYGTTFKGALDNVEGAVSKLRPILEKYGLNERQLYFGDNTLIENISRTGYWFHVDGALGAAYAPYCSFSKPAPPIFDFRIPEIHSISVSGHKWIGSPFPCCVYMSKVKYQLSPPANPNYIGSPDSTFAGSRNAFSALILWNFISRHSFADMAKRAMEALLKAKKFVSRFESEVEKGAHNGEDLWLEYSEHSLSARFKRPNDIIINKFSLSCESLYVNGILRHYAHIFIMPATSESTITALLKDLKHPDAFPIQVSKGVFVPKSGRGFQ